MTDFVYICRTGDNEELKYSIRSVLKSFPDSRIWVVGGKPSWYKGHYIEVDQNHDKYTNALNNLRTICKSKEISESFILMNDDFFILKHFDLNTAFHGGYLIDKIDRYTAITQSSKYITKLKLTYQKLINEGIEQPIDYELHVPIKMEKDKLNNIITKYDAFLWRSMYGNIYGIGGIKIKDVKFYANSLYNSGSSQVTDESIFVSTQDQSFKNMYETIFKNIFSERSSLED
jgi:hypothetical protein